MIDAIILAAGYGTRLEREISQDVSGRFAHLRGIPKPLLPVGSKPLIDYWIDDLQRCSDVIDNIYVVTNARFYSQFAQWANRKGFPLSNIVRDTTNANEERLGAVADLELVVEEKKIKSDFLVIAGDTLFYSEFNLRSFINTFLKLQSPSNLICYYTLKNHAEVAKRGVIEIDDNHRVINFLEKPKPEQTHSNRATPPLYLYSKEIHADLKAFVHEHTKTRDERDAPGLFVAWLFKRKPVYAAEIPGRFDVGGLDDYVEANKYFEANKIHNKL